MLQPDKARNVLRVLWLIANIGPKRQAAVRQIVGTATGHVYLGAKTLDGLLTADEWDIAMNDVWHALDKHREVLKK